jgi:hypothetical protein
LLAAVTLPDEVREGRIDLGYFDDNRSYFWTLYAIYVLTYAPLIVWRKVDAGQQFRRSRKCMSSTPSVVVFFAMAHVKKRWVSGVIMAISLAWFIWGFGW